MNNLAKQMWQIIDAMKVNEFLSVVALFLCKFPAAFCTCYQMVRNVSFLFF